MSTVGPAALVVSLAVGIVAALATLIVALLRMQRTSPEQRQADTEAFTAVTTGVTALSAREQAFMDRLEGRIAALEASDRAKTRRIAQLEDVLRANGLPVPPEPA